MKNQCVARGRVEGYTKLMRHTYLIPLLFSGLALVNGVNAADALPGDAPTAATNLEPEVTIVDGTEGRIEEYRMSGRLYMIKITPKKGREYYLVDSDGDGHMDSRRNELAPNLLIPSWVLIRW